MNNNKITEHSCSNNNCDCSHNHKEHKNNHCDCAEHSHNHNHCDCEHNNNHEHCDCNNHKQQPKLVKMCVLEEGVRCTNCGACDMCDLDPNKICDNCGKCLDTLNTNSKGFVEVPIDKIIMGETEDEELNQLLVLYGLDEDDEEE